MAQTVPTIRPAHPGDAAGVSRLLARSYGALLASHYPRTLVEAMLPSVAQANAALLRSRTWYVIEDPELGIIACGGWTRERPGGGINPPGLGHMRNVATDPAFTRRGYGAAIVRRCLRDAAGAGMVTLESISTLMAVPFYKACGFQALRRVHLQLAPGLRFPCVQMLRDVDYPPV
ncbi:MAG TPA: GNAT family N-acetyltransferase [Paracoccaceae bacterium]|nr:GNAT family N-acetyltransferase [Paracoccaceae bacterium]